VTDMSNSARLYVAAQFRNGKCDKWMQPVRVL
jgi:hypothetical protein